MWFGEGNVARVRGVGSPPGGVRVEFNSGQGKSRRPGATCPGRRGADSEVRGERDGSAQGARAVQGPVPVVRGSGRPQHGAAHRCGRRRRRQDRHKEWSGKSAVPLWPGHTLGRGRFREGSRGRAAPQLPTLPLPSGNPRQARHPDATFSEELNHRAIERLLR